jgi:hypothetical protein
VENSAGNPQKKTEYANNHHTTTATKQLQTSTDNCHTNGPERATTTETQTDGKAYT